MRKKTQIISGAAAVITAFYTAVFVYFYAALPCNISAEKNAVPSGGFSAARLKQTSDTDFAFCLGNIPIKFAGISYKERPKVIPGGMPFGIKIRSEGVMVISVDDGSPAKNAGIRTGDVIMSVNGGRVTTNAEIAEQLQCSSSKATIVFRRGESEISVKLTPENNCGELKMGAWVRDSAAGIGTLTYCDPEDGSFGGLGHAVSDVTTGDAVPLGTGEITRAQIYDIIPGREGCAGELCGIILPNSDIGTISGNSSSGVFGKLEEPLSGEPIPVAFRQEVQTGTATVITTIEGSTPKEYSIEIERINLLDLNGSKAMVIRITDSELLEKTGGIVRGMSGSPIIQNGRLAGAVTHVLVNDPTRGYAVFAETMLEDAA
ncbi:MAG: SpoIVB peptidase [Oscillospiraceae bacterium]|nr:SpoIVB peptidase [Oscillospiraceae bacterium]